MVDPASSSGWLPSWPLCCFGKPNRSYSARLKPKLAFHLRLRFYDWCRLEVESPEASAATSYPSAVQVDRLYLESMAAAPFGLLL